MIAIALACGPKLLFADEPTDRARRHRAGADPRPPARAAARAVHGDGARDARPRRGRRPGRDDCGDVRRAASSSTRRRASCSTRRAIRTPKRLLKSIPKLSQPSHTRLEAIVGRPPDLVNPPAGCKFAPRCPYAQPRCRRGRARPRRRRFPGPRVSLLLPGRHRSRQGGARGQCCGRCQRRRDAGKGRRRGPRLLPPPWWLDGGFRHRASASTRRRRCCGSRTSWSSSRSGTPG